MTVHLDASSWPLVVAKFERDRSPGDLDGFLAQSRAMLDRKAPHGMVVDLSELAQLDARERKLIAEWTRARERESFEHE